MAPSMVAQSSIPLRVVTQRLSATPTRQLPHIAPCLAASITECRKVFDSSQDSSRDGSETTVLIHKLKTQLSALLQDRSSEGRLSAIILIKATVEVGGRGLLQGVGPWLRGLIAMIGRPDPPATKSLCIITITRIFLLTRDYQSLTREITTPSLPVFIAAALSLAKQPGLSPESQNPSILVVLQAFSELITLHPSSFRPFVQRIQMLVLPLIAPAPSNIGTAGQMCASPGVLADIARSLFVLLHVCAPKNTAGEEWARSLQMIISSTQRTADRIFRSLVEDWRPRTDSSYATDLESSETVGDGKTPPLDMPGWTGIAAGVERLDGLLRTMQAFIFSATSTAVVLPLSNILNAADRVLSVLQPCGVRGSRVRPQFGRDEREGLAVGLPQLHVSVMAILSLLISRMGSAFAPMKEATLNQVSWVLEHERTNDKVRRASYDIVSQVLTRFGLSLSASCVTPISYCMRACCEDVLSTEATSTQDKEAPTLNGERPSDNKPSSTNVDVYLKPVETIYRAPTGSQYTIDAAEKLLPLAFTNLPSSFFSHTLRARLDRTAILTSSRTAMLASVMTSHAEKRGNQPSKSILPMLARAHPGASEVEALLRPQVPITRTGIKTGEGWSDKEEEDLEGYGQDFRDNPRQGFFGFDSNGFSDKVTGASVVSSRASEIPLEATKLSTVVTGDAASLSQPASPMLESQPFYTSKKRGREIDTASEAETGQADMRTAGQSTLTEVEALHKRTCLTNRENEQYPGSATKADDIGVHNTTVAVTATSKPAIVRTAEAKVSDGLEDSDESDFVMPTLYSDSEEEDNSGEENDKRT